MNSSRAILALKYTPVSVAGGVRKAVGGFLRYVQYRDQHVDGEMQVAFDAYTRYVAHRDRSSPGGRVFGPDPERTDVDRKALVAFVGRSTRDLSPKWVKGRDGRLVDRQRAVYTFVLSPEDWRGLDLRQLARAAMARLDQDTGGLGPWFAAEHRNTAHHHVHIVLAARREVAPGQYRSVLINRQRLERMKEAMRLEISRQRGLELKPARIVRSEVTCVREVEHGPSWKRTPRRRISPSRLGSHSAAIQHQRDRASHVFNLNALGSHYRRQMERELEREQRSRELGGWLR